MVVTEYLLTICFFSPTNIMQKRSFSRMYFFSIFLFCESCQQCKLYLMAGLLVQTICHSLTLHKGKEKIRSWGLMKETQYWCIRFYSAAQRANVMQHLKTA